VKQTPTAKTTRQKKRENPLLTPPVQSQFGVEQRQRWGDDSPELPSERRRSNHLRARL
jgi:hypothetical protein